MMKYNLIQFYIASSDILSHYIFVDICDSRFSFIKSENDHIPAFLKIIFHFFLLNFILRSRRFIKKKNLNLLKKILRTKMAKFYILFKYYTNLFSDIKNRFKSISKSKMKWTVNIYISRKNYDVFYYRGDFFLLIDVDLK